MEAVFRSNSHKNVQKKVFQPIRTKAFTGEKAAIGELQAIGSSSRSSSSSYCTFSSYRCFDEEDDFVTEKFVGKIADVESADENVE